MLSTTNIYLVLVDEMTQAEFNGTEDQHKGLMTLPTEVRSIIFDNVFESTCTYLVDISWSTCLVSPHGQQSVADMFIPGAVIGPDLQYTLDEVRYDTVAELAFERKREGYRSDESGSGLLLASRLLSSEATEHAYRQTVFEIKSLNDLVKLTRSIRSFDATKYVKRLKFNFTYHNEDEFEQLNSSCRPHFIAEEFENLQYVDIEFGQGYFRWNYCPVPLYADTDGPTEKVGEIVYLLMMQLHGLRNLQRVRVKGLACSSLAQAIASTLVGEPCLHLVTDDEILAEKSNPDPWKGAVYSVAVSKAGPVFDFDYEDEY